jgi:hypothetical protein
MENPSFLLWILFATAGVVILVSLLKRRQSHLEGLLKDHSDRQMKWLKMRQKVTNLREDESANGADSNEET